MLPSLATAAAAAAAAIGVPGPGTTLAGCPVLPKDHAFNRDVSRAPVDPRSASPIRARTRSR